MTRTGRIRSTVGSAIIGAGLLALSGGCYSKVVDGKGIGADSNELRRNHEFGSDHPIQDLVTRENERHQR